MVYLKPPAVTRHLANPLAIRRGSRGIATLTVAGRRTGDHHKVPVIPVEVNRSRYLVCPYGESDWVRNLRAAGTGELSSGGRTEAFRATEVPANEREPIITGYRQVAGSYVDRYFAKLPDPRDHPVFQVDKM
jgi:deazaflavin-dependent oxidoreductase (nitroreductase family)